MMHRTLTLAVSCLSVVLVTGSIYSFAWSESGTRKGDYAAAVWNKLHFSPAIDRARDEQCLSCHSEILKQKVRTKSPAGIKAKDSIAWYQAMDTYTGDQETFHWRHISSPFAKAVMKLSCNFCHRGHDPREEAPGSSATAPQIGKATGFALRKTVDPSQTCLKCHGSFPYKIMQLPGPWHEVRPLMESPEIKNGCLGACHKVAFRTNRHNVTYLNRDKIEELSKDNSDTCFGCHGGRAWYRNSYPYPRNPWPGMDKEIPKWAKDRPTQSEARFRIGDKQGAAAGKTK